MIIAKNIQGRDQEVISKYIGQLSDATDAKDVLISKMAHCQNLASSL